MDERIIRMKLDQLRQRAIVGRWPIEGWEARLADHLAPDEYRYHGDWQVLGPGDHLLPAGQTLFLRASVDTPATERLEDLYLAFDTQGLEGLLSVDGRPYAGIDENHPRVTVPHAGELDLSAEFMCLGRSLARPELRRERARLREVAFVQVDRAVEGALYDLVFAWEASLQASDTRRRELLHAALEEALLVYDLTAPEDLFHQQVEEARRVLNERVQALAPDPEAGSIYLAGHTHIDTAWLWPLRETIRKCGRTFSTACRLMERYPDFRFSCSQPQLYAYTKKHYPELYEEIVEWVDTGRWECTGAMWVETDCNVPSGESLIRQMLHGLAFYREEFGQRPRTCWLPDVFGYPASLPQILRGCGVEQFMTCKLHWQARNPFPMHLFWWEGIDGTRLLAHIPKLQRYYNGSPTPEQLRVAWDNYLQKAAYPELLLPFGYGDGGGGVTEEMLEFAARAEAYPGLPATRQGVEEDYFAQVHHLQPDLPRWVGELYLETHRGTYTTQSEAKKANRKNELLLREAEMMGLLANMGGADLDLAPLRQAWENLLLLQFHDILPGSSIGEVYREGDEDYQRIQAIGEKVRDGALAHFARRAAEDELLVFNSLSWERQDVARATVPASDEALELATDDGDTAPVQVLSRDSETMEVLFAPPSVPATGFKVLKLRPASEATEHSLRVESRRLENRFFLLEVDDDGDIVRLYDKRAEREIVPPGSKANTLHLFQDGPEREAAWNVHATYEKREYDWDPGISIESLAEGPVRAGLRIARTFRETHLEQDIVLYDRLPRIDFITRIDWQARQVLLKAAFPLQVRSPHATFEIQFGAVERPTHRNTSWEEEKFEVCAHHWADLSEAGYGVSLLNDSRYGYDVHDNVLRLTLLRGPEYPDPEADRGYHELVYSLLPHGGRWADGGTVRRAWELNAPLSCHMGSGGSEELREQAFFAVEGPAILTACKPPREGEGWIVRLYEPHGARGRVTLRAPGPIASATACNLVEEAGDELAADGELAIEGDRVSFAMRPFQIRTLRLVLG